MRDRIQVCADYSIDIICEFYLHSGCIKVTGTQGPASQQGFLFLKFHIFGKLRPLAGGSDQCLGPLSDLCRAPTPCVPLPWPQARARSHFANFLQPLSLPGPGRAGPHRAGRQTAGAGERAADTGDIGLYSGDWYYMILILIKDYNFIET